MNPDTDGVSRLLNLWGKLESEGIYHPAIYHLLDVGHVAGALLAPSAAPRFRNVLARVLGQADAESLIGWLPLLAAMHDIGKIASPFQGQDRSPRTRHERLRLEQAGYVFGRTRGESYPHPHVGAVFVERAWGEIEEALPPALVDVMRDVVSGHHGRFAGTLELEKTTDYLEFDEPPEWAVLRGDAYSLLRPLLAPRWREAQAKVGISNRRAATLVLTGFTILCDWLGSDTQHFEAASSIPLPEYIPLSRRRAEEAVQALGFSPPRVPPVYSTFSALFPQVDDPRPLQDAVDELTDADVQGPALYVIEAPTGEGKTEAALALARRLAVHGLSDELYLGLPTTATSNQMFGRVAEFLGRCYPEGAPLKLIHGQAALIEDDLQPKFAEDVDEDQIRAGLEWFAPKKRALLAAFGVGTVDQIELATLSARHYMLRLFALAGKVVIIDEVHAYDTYMSTILDHVLQWLAVLGSSVIMLSATLPQRRHRELANAFRGGLGMPDLGEVSTEYPLIAGYTRQGVSRCTPAASQPNRQLLLSYVADDTPGAQAQRLQRLIEGGGAVCRLCNTVDEAQSIFAAVRLETNATECYLLHARFPLEQRHAIERCVVERFGPSSSRCREERLIVVATQVLEQSLDLDFDLMITDHGPVDLLLQRAGRVWRHLRSRASGHEDARLFVQLLRGEGGLPNFGAWKFVYDEFILWKSLLVLEERLGSDSAATISLPADYRPLIEAVYDSLPGIPEGHVHRDALEKAYHIYCEEREKAVGEARLRLIPDPSPTAGITEGAFLDFREDEEGGSTGWGIARTRLGAESLTLIPLYRQSNGALAVDPEGREIVGPTCDRAMQLRLQRRAIPLTISPKRRRIRQALAAGRDTAPAWFRRASLLRFAYPLILEGDRASYGGATLRLDAELGLEVKTGGNS